MFSEENKNNKEEYIDNDNDQAFNDLFGRKNNNNNNLNNFQNKNNNKNDDYGHDSLDDLLI